jgi:hypothetical protein
MLEHMQRMSTKGSKFPGVPSLQFQLQMSCSQSESGPGDHLFNARSGFAHTKPDEVANFGLFATQTIMSVYWRPKDGLTADVLSNVVRQLCTHTAAVVEQPASPLAREQFFAQASASVVMAPPVDPSAPEVPPLEVAPPVPALPSAPPEAPVVPPVDVIPALLLLPHENTQEPTVNRRAICPIFFFDISSPS